MYRHGHTKSLELASIFVRCTRLLNLPVSLVFVFNGPDHPNCKRNKAMRGTPHWLVRDMQEMLECFRFSWLQVRFARQRYHFLILFLQAPGEAEAELAWLSRCGNIDAILTDDSDVAVFGATSIIRL